MNSLETMKQLKGSLEQKIIGQSTLIDRLILSLITDGNILLEGMPGLAKTRAVKALSDALGVKLSRIQFTPDLLPSDITGSDVYEPNSEEKFIFQPGPIMNSIILADEINRAPAKVQSALLEAMEEHQVTVGGKTHKLPPLFMVLATQNPVDQEGTYPLPEAQMDRFQIHYKMDYLSIEDEKKVINLVRGESLQEKEQPFSLDEQTIFKARDEVNRITVSDEVVDYIARLVDYTRFPQKISEELGSYINWGASPRGSIALDRCSRGVAWLNGRDYVTPDDVRNIFHDTLRHRISSNYLAISKGLTKDNLLDMILNSTKVL